MFSLSKRGNQVHRGYDVCGHQVRRAKIRRRKVVTGKDILVRPQKDCAIRVEVKVHVDDRQTQ